MRVAPWCSALALVIASACSQTVAALSGDAGMSDARAADATPVVDAGARCAICACGPRQVCANGACREARPRLEWARTFHAGRGAALSASADAAGDVWVGGYVQVRADLGLGAVPASVAGDALVARFSASGAIRWARQLAGDAAEVRWLAADRVGVWGGGVFGRVVQVGSNTLRSARAPDGFVTRLDTNGVVGATLQLTGNGDEQVASVAATSDGGAFITGYYQGEGRLGAAVLSPPGSPAGFAARLDANGAVRWTRSFGTANTTLRGGVALADGGFAVVGIFSGALDLGAPLRAMGGFDVFVANLGASGEVRWATSYGGAGDDLPDAIAADAQGNLYVSSASDRGLTVGGATRGDAAALLVALDGRGAVRWSMGLGANSRSARRALAVDVAGNVLVAGTFRDADVPEGFDAFHSNGGTDVWLIRYDRDARAMDGRSFGGPGDDSVGALAARPCGGFVVSGAFQGVADLGGVTVTGERADGFVAAWTD